MTSVVAHGGLYPLTADEPGASAAAWEHAVTLLCYEHFRVAAPTMTPERTLGPDAMQALHQAWDDLAAEVETREWRKETSTAVWRKVVGRSLPDTYEVHNLMGILTNTLKRFGHPRYRTPESEKAMGERGLKVAGKAATMPGQPPPVPAPDEEE